MTDLPGSPHIDENTLERYAMNRLPETETVPVDEHLLICPDCQDCLAEIDRLLADLNSALGPPQGSPSTGTTTPPTGTDHCFSYT